MNGPSTVYFLLIFDLLVNKNNFTTSNLAEGTNLYFTNNRVRAIISSDASDINASFFDVSVGGNLTVYGDFVDLKVSNILTESKTVTLARGAANPTSAEGAGIKVGARPGGAVLGARADGRGRSGQP